MYMPSSSSQASESSSCGCGVLCGSVVTDRFEWFETQTDTDTDRYRHRLFEVLSDIDKDTSVYVDVDAHWCSLIS